MFLVIRSIQMLLSLWLSLNSSVLFAQGAAVIVPMSTHTADLGKTIEVYIHNRLESDLSMEITIECDVDGLNLVGSACDKYFASSFTDGSDNKQLNIKKAEKIKGTVNLRGGAKHYALFKPKFIPNLGMDGSKNNVMFQLNYQPGYLYIVDAKSEAPKALTFAVLVLNKKRRAKFTLDLSSLTQPQVTNISAKILDAKEKKLIHFLRLASGKILDPKRKIQELEAEFAEASDTRPVCYEMFIENVVKAEVTKLSNCT